MAEQREREWAPQEETVQELLARLEKHILGSELDADDATLWQVSDGSVTVETILRDAFKAKDAEVASLRAQLERMQAFMERQGYRRCDIPACNCNGWHGGHSAQRLVEIGDALTDAGIDLNGKTILGGVKESIAAVSTLRAEGQALLQDMQDLAAYAFTRHGNDAALYNTAKRLADRMEALLLIGSPRRGQEEKRA